jgi:hypothetical protein
MIYLIHDYIESHFDAIYDEILTNFQSNNEEQYGLLDIPNLEIQCILIPNTQLANWM